MLDYIDGEIVDLNPESLVLNCNGIGYKLLISSKAYELFIHEDRLKIKVYLNVREDALTLYGFHSDDERKLFFLLTGVTGIGPKVAMSVLSEFHVGDFISAIEREDIKALQSPAGIGRKTAERILLELKDKVPKESWDFVPLDPIEKDHDNLVGRSKMEAKDALLGLGYSEKEIRGIFDQIEDGLSLEETLKISLKLLSRG